MTPTTTATKPPTDTTASMNPITATMTNTQSKPTTTTKSPTATKPPSTTQPTTNTAAMTPTPTAAQLSRNTRPKLTRAQIALAGKLPIPMHRTANGGYSDIIANDRDGGAFSRRIAADCQSVVYYLDGADDLPLSLLDECLVESQRQSDESGMPGVLELVTPAGRVLRFPITPAPLCEVLPPPPANE
jgi:hypothetical protein